MTDRLRVTSADYNGHDWDGSPLEPTPLPEWFHSALNFGRIKISDKHSTDYAVWEVAGVEAWPGDHIVHAPNGLLTVEKAQTDARLAKATPE